MNEELSENVVLGDNAEEKNREVYRQPALKKIEVMKTQAGGMQASFFPISAKLKRNKI